MTQFQAQAYKEMLPPGGPVKTQIIGMQSKEVEDQAQRVKDFMNYQITEVMEEYDLDTDQMLSICRLQVRRSRRYTSTR